MIFLISYCDSSGGIRTHRTNNSAKAYDFAIGCSRPVNLTVWMDTQVPRYHIPRNFICESKDAIAAAFATVTTEFAKGVTV